MLPELLPLDPSDMIISAAPDWAPRGGSVTKNSRKTPCPPCTGGALMLKSFRENNFCGLEVKESMYVWLE
jgi:hypothetical protein